MERDVSVFILLTNTGTLFTKVIQSYTKAPYNHASISFDRELSELYSFGRKHPSNPFDGGFVVEGGGVVISPDTNPTEWAMMRLQLVHSRIMISLHENCIIDYCKSFYLFPLIPLLHYIPSIHCEFVLAILLLFRKFS